ncbi:hypothetical protein E5288_WYG010925 [Bos mutus]|uniref:Metaxin-2 n=2 Tax=Bos mutus TaxID=72004 RepID=A0A6B0R3F9_9CETA|nr:hypothetical protein [Bos mutus]
MHWNSSHDDTIQELSPLLLKGCDFSLGLDFEDTLMNPGDSVGMETLGERQADGEGETCVASAGFLYSKTSTTIYEYHIKRRLNLIDQCDYFELGKQCKYNEFVGDTCVVDTLASVSLTNIVNSSALLKNYKVKCDNSAAEPWPENATLYQQLKGEQILLSDNAASLAVQAFLQMCNLPIKVVCRANAEYMSPSGKVPFIHVGNQVVSELGPIVQFVKAKGHSLSDGLDEVQKAEMKAYMELVNNMLLTAELYLQWCDDATVGEITHARYGSPYPWPLNHILAYQKQWEVKRKMKAIGWGNKTLDQVLEDVDQCCQALSQRLGTQPYFFNKQPTELDALVFGHLYTILTTQMTNDELSEKVKNYSNLLAFCRRIEQHYFGKGSSSIRLS